MILLTGGAGYIGSHMGVAQPARYFDNNVAGSISLVRAMERAGVRQLVFSSSATVYGDPGDPVAVPVPESAALVPANPENSHRRRPALF